MDPLPDQVDRQTIVPFHLKLFYRNGTFHRLDEFSPLSELPPHLQIYTWHSCTLRELSHLLTSALPALLPNPAIGTRLAFKLIFPDTRPSVSGSGPARFMTKELGSVVIGDGGPGILPDEDEASNVAGGPMAGSLGGDPEKTLLGAKFVIGDYVTCTILPALANGSVAPPPARGAFGGSSRGGFGGDRMVPGGPRENGFGFRGRGGLRGGGGYGQGMGLGAVPSGEWRRGERVPEGPATGGGGRGRGGYGGGFGGRGIRY